MLYERRETILPVGKMGQHFWYFRVSNRDDGNLLVYKYV